MRPRSRWEAARPPGPGSLRSPRACPPGPGGPPGAGRPSEPPHKEMFAPRRPASGLRLRALPPRSPPPRRAGLGRPDLEDRPGRGRGRRALGGWERRAGPGPRDALPGWAGPEGGLLPRFLPPGNSANLRLPCEGRGRHLGLPGLWLFCLRCHARGSTIGPRGRGRGRGAVWRDALPEETPPAH